MPVVDAAVARLYPPDARGLVLPRDQDELRELYRPPRGEWARLNMVAALNGSATGPDGTSNSISSVTDRMLLGIIRSWADVILVGAATVRAEGYVLAENAVLAVVTATGDLTGHNFDSARTREGLVLVAPASKGDAVAERSAALGARVLTVAEVDGRMADAAVLPALRDAGFASVVCEGGRSLAGGLVAAGALDELCLTVSPAVTLPGDGLFGGRETSVSPFQLAGMLLDDDSVLYERWRRAAVYS